MSYLKALCIAFSIYSKIPVPIFEWKEEDMQYHLLFFPWIGAVIGGFLVGWQWLCNRLGIGEMAFVLVATAIPLLITGGFHVDGYMDTMDAFHSYQPKERKLEILKDPHIGAFAVIMLAVLGLIYVAAMSEISETAIPVYAAGFFLARCLSGIAVLKFPSAKKNGMLYTFSSTAKGNAQGIVTGGIYLQLVLCSGLMLWLNWRYGAAMILAAGGAFWYYHHRSLKELGGITGDTAGFFVTVAETAMLVAAAVLSIFGV